MSAPGVNTYAEITTQPDAWAQAVQVVRENAASLSKLTPFDYSQVVFTGCGSTYYLSLAAATLAQMLTGAVCRALPASELLLYPAGVFPREDGRTLLVAVSRSGTTTETLRAIEAFRAAGRGHVIVISNYPDTPMATLGQVNLIIPAGREESVAQTRSFASMYVAAAATAAVWGGDDALLAALDALRPVGERLVREYAPVAQRRGEDLSVNQVFFLGSGPRYGLACEAALKMKEMSLTAVEPFHFLEFRHGPMSMITPQTLVVALLSEAQRAAEAAVVTQMAELGGQTLTLAESQADIVFASGLPELARGVLYLPLLQLMAYHRSIAKGLDPDRPHNLSKVIELDAV
jgi:glucosamine--fructose-6-phosphate aminotransferase (isomerizing)